MRLTEEQIKFIRLMTSCHSGTIVYSTTKNRQSVSRFNLDATEIKLLDNVYKTEICMQAEIDTLNKIHNRFVKYLKKFKYDYKFLIKNIRYAYTS